MLVGKLINGKTTVFAYKQLVNQEIAKLPVLSSLCGELFAMLQSVIAAWSYDSKREAQPKWFWQ